MIVNFKLFLFIIQFSRISLSKNPQSPALSFLKFLFLKVKRRVWRFASNNGRRSRRKFRPKLFSAPAFWKAKARCEYDNNESSDFPKRKSSGLLYDKFWRPER